MTIFLPLGVSSLNISGSLLGSDTYSGQKIVNLDTVSFYLNSKPEYRSNQEPVLIYCLSIYKISFRLDFNQQIL